MVLTLINGIRFFLMLAVILQAITVSSFASVQELDSERGMIKNSSPHSEFSPRESDFSPTSDLGEEESAEESLEDSDSFDFENLIPGQASALSYYWISIERIRVQSRSFFVRASSPLHRPPVV